MTCFQSLCAVRERRCAKPMQCLESRTLYEGSEVRGVVVWRCLGGG